MTPERTPELDRRLLASIRGFHRVRWALVTVIAVTLLTASGVFGFLVIAQQSQLNASCSFFGELAALPVTTGPNGKASQLGVQLILNSRQAYLGQRCGHLPRADPSVLRWARYYRLKVPR